MILFPSGKCNIVLWKLFEHYGKQRVQLFLKLPNKKSTWECGFVCIRSIPVILSLKYMTMIIKIGCL